MAKRRDQKKKAAHRTLMAQHAAAKQKKMMDTVMQIQEVLQANPHLAEQLQNGQGLQDPGISLSGS